MKKITIKQRNGIVALCIEHRQGGSHRAPPTKFNRKKPPLDWQKTKAWFERKKAEGLNFSIKNKREIILSLPNTMNFSDEYEKTALHLTAIRLLTDKTNKSKKRYKLRHVNFDELKKISSSAALVLTAELSKWNDSIRNNLTPYTDNWDKDILHQLHDLGFFHLFKKTKLPINNTETTKNINLVKYIKGSCGDSKKTATLKSELQRLVGDKISKWAFLHSGLTEAITNVSHHAYPQNRNFVEKEKNWYLTGSYNKEANELKISFYDQGIGIPKSLPESEVWEKILSMTAIVGIGKGMLDETLLSAAMEMDRTSTGENDRGKGLQDLLEFIRQRKEGYLTVISRHGLYRLLIKEGKEIVKKHSFRTPLKGTLIIWNVSLTDSG